MSFVCVQVDLGNQEKNVVRIGEYNFEGTFIDTLGTEMIFDTNSSTEINWLSRTEKVLVLNPLIKK
jgi:hypothetical protein